MASPAMQSLLAQIQDLSNKNLSHLQNSLKAAESGLQQTAQQQGGGFILHALQQLNAQSHTFGCVALLCALLLDMCSQLLFHSEIPCCEHTPLWASVSTVARR